jgi:hypothetical protein
MIDSTAATKPAIVPANRSASFSISSLLVPDQQSSSEKVPHQVYPGTGKPARMPD